MGMSTGGGKPGGLQSEINVTPLIDVLLVLLIIFLLAMPVMIKMETLQVPRKIDETQEMPDPNASQLTIKVQADLTLVFNDGNQDHVVQFAELAGKLQARLGAMHTSTEKVVFVDFDDAVPWSEVVTIMDTIRSLATDVNHDDVKVALKVKEDQPNKP